jgi:hypothetical protein
MDAKDILATSRGACLAFLPRRFLAVNLEHEAITDLVQTFLVTSLKFLTGVTEGIALQEVGELDDELDVIMVEKVAQPSLYFAESSRALQIQVHSALSEKRPVISPSSSMDNSIAWVRP